MISKVKISSLVILILILETASPLMVSKVAVAGHLAADNVNLVIDTLNYKEGLPSNFRKTSDLTAVVGDKTLNLKGLDKLNISGEQQFSEFNLPNLIKAIGTTLPLTVVDLRQESHGFINGIPVSWANARNNANAGLTREQVLQDEDKKLKSIKLNVPLRFYNHPDITVTPTEVQNESELVKSKGLDYARITVRDGGIPEEDMVDFFIDLVKGLPRNSWINFHCKEGIGRTTTFMIMYDMMLNHTQANAEEIIKRQLALARFDQKEIRSFYNNKERMDFLKKFYEYCKENGTLFNTKWSDWKKGAPSSWPLTFKGADKPGSCCGYIKNPVAPAALYVVRLDSLTSAERTMMASLQGLVNGHCSSQIYTLDSSQPDYKIWLEDLSKNYKVSYSIITDPWKILSIYKEFIDGYVLYSRKGPKDPSINNACSLASLSGAIVVDEAIVKQVRDMGITKVLGDCRNTDEYWAYDNLWNRGLNHSTAIQLSPDKADALRDYAIMTKSLVFYEGDIDKTKLRAGIFSSMEKNSICLGWGLDEFINVSTASKHGVSIVAADWSYNLSVLSAFPSLNVHKKSPPKVSAEENVHYVTFMMSDGDNQQWYLGTNYGSHRWFGYPRRNELALGWSISPSLHYLAPTVFKLYKESMDSDKMKNNFIVSPSGSGYMYPSKYEKGELDTYISSLSDYMLAVDERYLSVIDDASFNNMRLWDRFTERPGIQGIFYLDYKRHDNFKGKILWSNAKPVAACRDLLWEGLESEDELIKNVTDRVNSGQVNVHSPEAYTFVYVHAWSMSCQDVEQAVNRLKQNTLVRVVTPEIFMEHIKENLGHSGTQG